MSRALLVFLILAAIACEPNLPTPPRPADATPVELAILPAADPASVSPVSHFRLSGALRGGVDPSGIALVAGEVGPRHLEQIAAGDPSEALAERIVPTTVVAHDGDLWLVPHVVLVGGERYDVVVGSRELVFPVTVDASAPPPLERVWPQTDVVVGAAALLFCGSVTLDTEDEPAVLFAGGPSGVLRVGTPAGAARHCLRFDPDDGSAEGTWFAPPSAAAGLLAPGPVDVGPAGAGGPVTCAATEVAFGPGCALVEDDRLVLRSPEEPLVWVVSGGGVETVVRTAGAEAPTLRGLKPNSTVMMSIETLDAAGAWRHALVEIHTGPPRARFVLNEVYANPIGPEPAQEWVEIVNDGSAPGDLAGLVFEDIGGEAELPSRIIEPGRFALLVNEAFSADGEYDVAPAPGTALVRLASVGKNGLSNAGEPMKLTASDGGVLSRFPPVPKPKAGESVARRTPDASDEEEASFFVAAPATPGAPNTGAP